MYKVVYVQKYRDRNVPRQKCPVTETTLTETARSNRLDRKVLFRTGKPAKSLASPLCIRKTVAWILQLTIAKAAIYVKSSE